VVDGRRVAWDAAGYLARVRAACFVCEMLAGAPGYEHDVVRRDGTGIVFLAKYPVAWGHLLVAPIEHREHVLGDFDVDQYLDLQRLVHRAGAALSSVVETERLYVLSLGSQQGNRHVHWHLVPLPPGVPYPEQQTALFDEGRGWLQWEPADLTALAGTIRDTMRCDNDRHG
jgi:diadenosine tetraphosphate (Ap4A) HIT family hydrolase